MLDFLPHSVDELAYLRVLLNANNYMSSFGSALSEVFGQNWSKQVEVVRFPSLEDIDSRHESGRAARAAPVGLVQGFRGGK